MIVVTVAAVSGVLAAFGLGWYLCKQTYAPQLAFTQDWVLRLVEEFAGSMDTALHMKKDDGYVVDEKHEAKREEVRLPEITGQLGAFIDRIEHPEARDISVARVQKALMEGMDSHVILEHLRAGDDPLWAKSIGE